MKIGIFDSGIGGLSVLYEAMQLLPHEQFIYYADEKHVPYGEKTREEIIGYVDEIIQFMIDHDCKAIVIACNTATSADVSILRKEYPDVPVVGIEPALKPAVQFMEHPRVLVMATPMTIREEKFQRLMARYEKEAEIYPLACPGIVEFVERGELNSADLKAFLYRLLKPYCEGTVDAIVLGCTHYPFVKDAIAEVMGNTVEFFDGGAGVARETRRRLMEKELLYTGDRKGRVIFENSAATLEKLVSAGFVQRKKKQLIPTEKGRNLIAVLPDNIKSPILTAEWESMLKQVEHGELSATSFMDQIADMSRTLVKEHTASEERFADLFPSSKGTVHEAVGVCPRCGAPVFEGKKGFFCGNRECSFALWKDNRFFSSKKKSITKSVAAALLKEGRISMSGLYSEKTGKTYDAEVILDDTGGKYVNFKLEFPVKKGRRK